MPNLFKLFFLNKNQIAIGSSTFFILIGAFITFNGLNSLSWPEVIPFANKQALINYLAVFIITTILLSLGSKVTKYSPISIGLIFALVLSLLCGQIWQLLAVIFFVISSILLGNVLLKLLNIKFKQSEYLVNFLIGAGFYGTIVGLIAQLPVNYPGVYGLILLLPFLICKSDLFGFFKKLLNIFLKKKSNNSQLDWLAVLISAFAIIYFIVALMPEKGHDALAMHLFIPAQLALNHIWKFDVDTYVWAAMPAMGDWIFSIVYMLSGESAARITNFVFILVGARLVHLLALWAGASATGSKWAVLIYISTPLTFAEGSTLYIESIWTSFIVAGILLFLRANFESSPFKSYLFIGAFFLGCAVATKSTTLPLLPLIFIFIIFFNKSAFKSTSKWNWLVSICLFSAVALFQHIRAFWITGNPFFPFYNAIFKSPHYLIENFTASHFGRGIKWDDLYRITFDSGKFLEATIGAAGFQWILLLIPSLIFLLLKMQQRPLILFIFGFAIYLVIFQFITYLRYVFPSTLFLSAVIGVVIGNITLKQVNIYFGSIWFTAINFVLFLNFLFLTSGSFYRDFGILAIVDKSFRSSYINTNIPIRSAVELVNQLNTDNSPVAFFAHPLAARLKSDALYPNWYNFRYRDAVNNATNLKYMAKVLRDKNVKWIVLDSYYISDGNKKAIITELSEEVSNFGSISIRKIRRENQYVTEIVLNPDFKSTLGWSLGPGVTYDALSGVMIVSVNALASQSFVVHSEKSYLNTVVSKCHKEKTQGRIQINWQDKNNKFLGASIKVFDCTQSWSEQSMEVISPKDAAIATVYVAGHNSIPIEFSKNSVRN